MKNEILIQNLKAARNELVLAYNTAKNSKDMPHTKAVIALCLADVSAELQFQESIKD